MTRMQAEKKARELNLKEPNLSYHYATGVDINASSWYVGKYEGGKLIGKIK